MLGVGFYKRARWQQARLLLSQAAWNIGVVSNDPAFTQMFVDEQDDKRRAAAEKWLSNMASGIQELTGEL